MADENAPIEFKFFKPTKLMRVTTLDHAIPAHVTSIDFSRNFDAPIHDLPTTLKRITFGHHFQLPFPHVLPPSLTHLTFGDKFNNTVQSLPNNLTHLTFGADFDLPVDSLPNSIVHLCFGARFNQQVENLPKSLTHLTFGIMFDQPVDKLPQSLRELRFHNLSPFNREINNLSPQLLLLQLSNAFAQDLVLPKHLTHLTFRCNSNQHQIAPLPVSLTNLKISMDGHFTHSLQRLPPALVEFTLSSINDYPPLDNLPASLKILRIEGDWFGSLDLLPKSLTKLYVKSHDIMATPLNKLPATLTSLELVEYQLPLDHLPHTLKSLAVDGFNNPIANLPPSLNELYLGDVFNSSVDYLPTSITTLSIGDLFNQPIKHLPSSITSLSLGDAFDESVDSLPPNLIVLSVGDTFNQTVNKLPGRSFEQTTLYLPSSITHLTMFALHRSPKLHLPRNLQQLSLAFGVNPENEPSMTYNVIDGALRPIPAPY